jgi:hypothetical protein
MPKPVTHTCPCSMAASNTCTAAIHLVLAALQRLLRQHLYFCTSKASKLQPNIRAVAVQKAERTVVRLEKLVAKCCHVGAHMPASRLPSSYVSIRQHTSAHVSIRQHTSAYGMPVLALAVVGIRQHTSAYVSIRQNTSAYGMPVLALAVVGVYAAAHCRSTHLP